MYTLKYEFYQNDFTRRHEEKEFRSLSDMKKWIHNNTIDDDYCKFLPTKDRIGRIEFCTKTTFRLWIHEIDSDDGILFTDGKYTGGIKHFSDSLVDWVSAIRQRDYKFI